MMSVASRAGRTRRFWTMAVLAGALTLAAGSAWAKGGYLGVQLQELNDALAEAIDLDTTSGVLITDVVEGSPADEAGLRHGDVIISFDGDDVTGVSSFTDDVGSRDPDDEVTIEVIRKGKTQSFDVTLGERQRSRRARTFSWNDGEDNFSWNDDDHNVFELDGDHGTFTIDRLLGSHAMLGVRVEKMNDGLSRYFGTDSGLLVMEVFEDTGAEVAGMQVGDVIVSAEGKDVEDVDSLRDAMEDLDDGDEAEIVVVRDGDRENLTVEVQNRGPRILSHGGDWSNLFEGHDGMRFFFSPDNHRRGPSRPRMLELHRDRSGLQDEMDELREELQELKEQLRELSDG